MTSTPHTSYQTWLYLLILVCAISLCRIPALWAISEADFFDVYHRQVIPFFDAGKRSAFAGVDGISIATWKSGHPATKGAVVILTGYTESFLKYREAAYDLAMAGYAVYMMDHRGMGLSQRLLVNDHLPVYVKDFGDYVEDLKTFVDTVVKADGHTRIFLLAHSMGGCVAANYLIKHDDAITAAALSAPMLGLNLGRVPEWLALLATSIATMAGHGSAYALNEGPRRAAVFENNALTSSYPRWSVWNKMIIPQKPEIVSGGATNSWVRESILATRHARKKARKIQTPLLLLQAEADTVVPADAQKTVCDRARACTIMVFANARHEILMEVDAIRDLAMDSIITFFDAAAAPVPTPD